MIKEVLAYTQLCITTDMNEHLIANISLEEVWVALFQMAPLKAPSPDGLPTLFYQRFWDIMGPSIHQCVIEFFDGRSVIEGINHTYFFDSKSVKARIGKSI